MHSNKALARLLGGTLLAGGSMLALAQVASADPVNAPNALPITIQCSNGQTYSAVTNGGGNAPQQNYSPAHDLNSTAVLQPVAFSDVTFTLYINGNPVSQQTQPPSTKGNAGIPANATLLQCSYTAEMSQTDPNTGDVYTFVGTGNVQGFIPASSR